MGHPEPIHDYTILPHAEFEMHRRGLDEAAIRRVLEHPEQREAVRPGREVLQSRIELNGQIYLIRVFVDVDRVFIAGDRDGLSNKQGREVLEGRGMKTTYDRQTDTLTVILREGVRVAESDEDKPGVILDYDDRGNLVSLEVLDASQRVSETNKMEFQTTG
jgi:uncharacterized protein YuzE